MTDQPQDRDEVVAAALRDLPVPDHRPGFWDRLEADLGAGDLAEPPRPTGPPTGELPAVAALTDRSDDVRRRTPLLFGAAAAAVLVVAVGLVLLGGDGNGGDDAELADQPEVTTTPTADEQAVTATSAAVPTPTTTTTVAPPAADQAPAEVVTRWLDALGEGDIATAASLTGPRTEAYIRSQGPDAGLEGFLTESEEGYGAWAGVEDRQVTVTAIGPLEFDGGTLQVVVVTGTYVGEGTEDADRIDVFPVIDDGEGFKVEHLAFSPDHDNDPVFTVPRETESGLEVVGPDVEINVFVPANGTVWFLVDDLAPDVDETSIVADEPFALHDPPGELEAGTHRLVLVAIGEDGTIAHFGGTFEVES